MQLRRGTPKRQINLQNTFIAKWSNMISGFLIILIAIQLLFAIYHLTKLSFYQVLGWLTNAAILAGILYVKNNFFTLTKKGFNLAKQQVAPAKIEWPKGFFLIAGTSTGELLNRGHATGLEGNQPLFLKLPDACQNIMVVGGIGSGKTTRAINPFLHDVLKQEAGALIFDIKGDYKETVLKLAQKAGGVDVTVIGINGKGVNLLKGLNPETASSFLKSVFFLSGGSSGGETFWIDTATDLTKNALGVLKYLPEHYSLYGLYDYLFDEEKRDEFTAVARQNVLDLDQREERIFDTYIKYYENVFSRFDEKVKQGVLASVAQVLAPFQHPDLVDAFCTESENNADVRDILSGSIFVVDLPLATWGIGAKAVYTFIKLRFFNILQSRQADKTLNQDTPVCFICDEYQEIISASKVGISDLNFWDKSRSAKCIGIISTQSINSFRAAIGDNTLANTIMQNFRQKICFRTEDIDTIQYFASLAGKAEVQRLSENQNSKVSGLDMGSEGQSVSWQEKSMVDAQLIRQLEQNFALAFYNIDGQAYDDVIYLEPEFAE